MNNKLYPLLLNYIGEEREAFESLISADNILGLNVTSDDIINFLEFTNEEEVLKSPIIGNVIITEGDILSVLKVVNDIVKYEGEYTLYINGNNLGTVTYLVSRVNMIYKKYNLNINLILDYSDNYNNYLSTMVTIIGSQDFVDTAGMDFTNANRIIV